MIQRTGPMKKVKFKLCKIKIWIFKESTAQLTNIHVTRTYSLIILSIISWTMICCFLWYFSIVLRKFKQLARMFCIRYCKNINQTRSRVICVYMSWNVAYNIHANNKILYNRPNKKTRSLHCVGLNSRLKPQKCHKMVI